MIQVEGQGNDLHTPQNVFREELDDIRKIAILEKIVAKNVFVKKRENGSIYFNDMDPVMQSRPLSDLEWIDNDNEIETLLCHFIHSINRYNMNFNEKCIVRLSCEEMIVLNNSRSF
ncbi:MAG: hypothetical protein V1740_04595 [Candidatus Woesearchaeota archaeon]